MLEFTPPLTLTESQALEGAAILDEALADVAGGRVDESLLLDFAGW